MKKTLALLLAAAGLAQADYVWKGGDTITNPMWATKENWEMTGNTKYSTAFEPPGPGQTNSDMWDPIVVENASGSIQNLEGWNLNLTLINSNLGVNSVAKFQNDGGKACYINIDANSSLSITSFGGGNDGQPLYLNCEGYFTLGFHKNQGGTGTYANLGSTGRMELHKYRNADVEGYTAKISYLEADLSDNVSFTLGVIEDRILIELTKGTTMNQLTDSDIKINASDEWIRVGSAAEVVNDGNKYYWVTQSQEGVKLSYVATAAPIPEPTTATLSLLALAGLAARRRRK